MCLPHQVYPSIALTLFTTFSRPSILLCVENSLFIKIAATILFSLLQLSQCSCYSVTSDKACPCIRQFSFRSFCFATALWLRPNLVTYLHFPWTLNQMYTNLYLPAILCMVLRSMIDLSALFFHRFQYNLFKNVYTAKKS